MTAPLPTSQVRCTPCSTSDEGPTRCPEAAKGTSVRDSSFVVGATLVLGLLVLLVTACTTISQPTRASGTATQLPSPIAAMPVRQGVQPQPGPVTVTPPPVPTKTPPPAAATAPSKPTATTQPTQTPWPTATPQPTDTLAPSATPTPAADAVVTGAVVNFRAGPGTVYDVIGLLHQGDPLTVTGRNPRGTWLAVTAADGTQGWVFAGLVRLHINLDTVAVAAHIPPTPTPPPAPVVQAAPPPAMPPPLAEGAVPAVNPLTGLPTDRAALARRPILVRVGNDPIARSVQAGLSQADVVYEEVMDGWGVTRYTAIFWSQDAPMVRPVRSARLLSIDLAQQFQGALAHSGASDPIRLRISRSPIIDLDEFFNPTPYTYGPGDWRTRLYTSLPRLRSYLRAKGLDQPVGLEGWSFSEGTPGGTPASTITIPYPNGTVVWRWDPAIGHYRRFIDGRPDVDANNGQQITAANVILLYAVHARTDIVEDTLGSTAIDIRLTDSGAVKIARGGLVIDGIWQRTNRFQPTKFSVPLKPGNSWVEIIPANPDIRKTHHLEPTFQNQ